MRFSLFIFSIFAVTAAEEAHVDFTMLHGRFKPLNGVNKGPLAPGGLLDVSQDYARLRLPFARLHDCHWPNPDVVDIHVVFPRPEADPNLPSSYDFGRTDDYIEAIRATGAQIIYRLGESIEHSRRKRYVHPPADPQKWTQICLGIIRHYPHIQYWEIWNEPENRPVMWTGTDEQYFELYRIASRAIRAEFPQIHIGGPAIGNSGTLREGKFTASDFLQKFVAMCAEHKLPLDFLSWHCYTDSPRELVERAHGIRALLDQCGFHKTESHLNEWNYLPGKNWKPIMKEAPSRERQEHYVRMSGSEGAAFSVAAMILLQDAPLDLAAFFHGEVGGFGLFNEYGVPNEVYRGFAGYADVVAGDRVSTRSPENIPILASIAPGVGTVLLANWTPTPAPLALKVKLPPGRWRADSERLPESSRHQLMSEGELLTIDLPSRSAAIVRFRRH